MSTEKATRQRIRDERKAGTAPTTMYVRYLGNRACYTLPNGSFLMVDRDELKEGEKVICEKGGGDVPYSDVVGYLAAMAEDNGQD